LPGPYLNASLIPPYPFESSIPAPRRSYIASQAPLPQTLPTFYSNIIQHKVSLIVNLSPFIEHGRVKADEYWPLKKNEVWDSTPGYQISPRQEPQRIGGEQWEAMQYQLRLCDTTSENPDYDFALLHVTSWPDFGACSGDVFAKLLAIIDESATGEGPMWIHCSAGIGRSGTVIAALLARDLGSSLIEAMQLKSPPSTPSLVREAALLAAKRLVDHERRYRPQMVQTADQLGMIASAVGTLLQQQPQQ
jgi:protein tyrosine phosphatase